MDELFEIIDLLLILLFLGRCRRRAGEHGNERNGRGRTDPHLALELWRVGRADSAADIGALISRCSRRLSSLGMMMRIDFLLVDGRGMMTVQIAGFGSRTISVIMMDEQLMLMMMRIVFLGVGHLEIAHCVRFVGGILRVGVVKGDVRGIVRRGIRRLVQDEGVCIGVRSVANAAA